jgi:hypothetical protein
MDSEKMTEALIRHNTLWEIQKGLNKDFARDIDAQDSRIVSLEKKLILVAALASGGGAALSQLILKIL